MVESFDDKLQKLRIELGYVPPSKGGLCVLYSEKGIDACLSEDYERFKKRRDVINTQFDLAQQIKDLYESIKLRAAQKRLADPKAETITVELTEEEWDLLEINAFIGQGDLYLNSRAYDKFFGRSLCQVLLLEISKVAQSDALAKAGGRRCLMTTVGIYRKEELKTFIRLLFQLGNKSPVSFALSLGNDEHGTNLCYHHKNKFWSAMDINQDILEIKSSEVPADNEASVELLANYIMDGFLDKQNDQTAFYSKLFATRNDAPKLRPLINALRADKNFIGLHEITAKYAARKTQRNVTVGWLAAKIGDVKTLEKIAVCHPEMLNQPVISGETPAFMTAQNGFVRSLQIIAAAKTAEGKNAVDLDRGNKEKSTPTFVAAQNGYTALIRFLVDAKKVNSKPAANIDSPYIGGATPTYMAVQNHFPSIFKILANAKNPDGKFRVDLNHRTKRGYSPILVATVNGDISLLKLLISQKSTDGKPLIDLNVTDYNGLSCAHFAACRNDVGILQVLAENGADLAKINNGWTPLDLAKEANHKETINFLLKWQEQVKSSNVTACKMKLFSKKPPEKNPSVNIASHRARL